MEFSWYSNEILCREFVPPLVVLDTISMISFHLCCMPGNSAWILWRVTYFRWLRSKLILAPLGMPKWVWPSMNQYRMFFVKTSTPNSKFYKRKGEWEGGITTSNCSWRRFCTSICICSAWVICALLQSPQKNIVCEMTIINLGAYTQNSKLNSSYFKKER